MIAGWSVLLGYVFFIATIPALIYNLLSSLLRSYFDIASGLYLELAIMALAVFIPSTLARRDVRLSTRLTAIIEISTMTLIVFLLAAHFWHKGGLIDPEQLSLRDFTFNQFHLGLVLAFVCFGGFESAMDLGSEARQPLASLPRVLTVVVGVLCLFFVFVAYGLVDAFHGVDPALDKQESPLTALAQILHLNALGLFITIGVLSSMMASALGCINAASRILYTLSHRGMVHRGAGKIHSRYATPARSITIVALIGFALALILTLCGVAPLDAMNYFSTIGGFGILSAYLKKRGELRPPHIFFSVITVLLLLVPLVGSLYPAPDYPMNVLPYIFLAVIALGIGYFLHIRRKDPQRLQSVETELLARD
jgi:amino acid transporter